MHVPGLQPLAIFTPPRRGHLITALAGARDLGQEVCIALTRADTGRGIVAGLCVAFIAVISDRLIGAWARRKKRELGLDHQ